MVPSRRHGIVFAWPYESLGGSQIYLLNIAARLDETFEVVAIMPQTASSALVDAWRQTGAHIEQVPASFDDRPDIALSQRPVRRFRKRATEAALRVAIRRVQPPPGILHLDLAPWTSARLLDDLSREAAVVVTLHTRLPLPSAWRKAVWCRRMRAFASRPRCRIVAASRHVRESLAPYLTPDRISAIPIAYSSVDLELADRVRQRAPHLRRLRKPGVHIVAVGQLIDRKGPWVLLEAARRLLRVVPDARFVWIAPDAPTAGQQARIAAAALGPSFVVETPAASNRPRQALFERVALADIFVLPSLDDGLPLALIEAMALGLPSVASDLNGIPEAVDDGAEGRLVPPGDSAAVAEALMTLAADEGLRRRMGHAAQARARRQFSSESTARVMSAIYRELADGTGPSGGSGQ
jgi:glycosyltransferase involved in cell wall biosynthesis